MPETVKSGSFQVLANNKCDVCWEVKFFLIYLLTKGHFITEILRHPLCDLTIEPLKSIKNK
jgi:hypothetical protein